MSALPISMRKFNDVLRLKYEAGLSQRQIASALHLSLGVINKYLNAAQSAGITWPLPDSLTESQLRRKLFPLESAPSEPVYAQPDFAAIHQELKRKGATRQLLWEEYAAANLNNHYQYTQFCFHYQQWRSRLRLSMRQVHIAGEKMFVDYAGQTVPIIDPATGDIHEREQRQAVAQVHSRSAVHIAQLDGLSLGAWVISRIQNPDAPFARRRIDRNDLLRSEPSQALFAQFLQPVIIGNRFGQFLARPRDAGVKTAPPIAPQGTERHFSGRDWAWPDCQDINQIDQDPARRPKALRDVVTKIFYNRLRGAVCFFCHAPSVTLDARLVGEAWPPRFLTKLVRLRVALFGTYKANLPLIRSRQLILC